MIAETDWLAVVLGALAAFMTGGLWFSPALFLNPWKEELGYDPLEKGGDPKRAMGVMVLYLLLLSCLLSMLAQQTEALILVAAVLLLGIFYTNLFQAKSARFSLITAGYKATALAVILVTHWLVGFF